MKPGKKEGVVAVLDTLSECKVVFDVLGSPQFISGDDSRKELASRFRKQTRSATKRPANPQHPIGFVEIEGWRLRPEFEVLPGDMEVVQGAAERVLNQEATWSRVFNRLTGRTTAAEMIMQNLEVLGNLSELAVEV